MKKKQQSKAKKQKTKKCEANKKNLILFWPSKIFGGQ